MVGRRSGKTIEIRREVLHRAAKKKNLYRENKRKTRDTAQKQKPPGVVKRVKAVKKNRHDLRQKRSGCCLEINVRHSVQFITISVVPERSVAYRTLLDNSVK